MIGCWCVTDLHRQAPRLHYAGPIGEFKASSGPIHAIPAGPLL